ncbi:hypothetical protein WMY93_019274 [Mugilogobius chulae]|uniref:C-type lectin domain-containing protein n=1 Tax=Mugilogobius chulae TaxID=88201 RepID=A0AAW0NQQ3_9GOBI
MWLSAFGLAFNTNLIHGSGAAEFRQSLTKLMFSGLLVNLTMVVEVNNTVVRLILTQYDDLASVTSDTERLDLLALLEATGKQWAWTGLYREPWNTWSDSSTDTSFYNWETQSNTDIYSTDDQCGCVAVPTGTWKVFPCSSSYKFFCYTDKGQTGSSGRGKGDSEVESYSKDIKPIEAKSKCV